jgi:hypothetical protein
MQFATRSAAVTSSKATVSATLGIKQGRRWDSAASRR